MSAVIRYRAKSFKSNNLDPDHLGQLYIYLTGSREGATKEEIIEAFTVNRQPTNQLQRDTAAQHKYVADHLDEYLSIALGLGLIDEVRSSI